jgi:hypothetical protein
MKKSILVAICALVLAFAGSATAAPISILDSNYLGYVNPGVPANANAEVAYINAIIAVTPGDTDSVNLGLSQDPYEVYRSMNAFGSLPVASTVGADSNNGFTGGTLNGITGFTYLLVKFGDESHVWVLNPAATVNIEVPNQLSGPGTGTSHYSLYNYTRVPDGGMTLMLLGGALVGLGALRRKFRA